MTQLIEPKEPKIYPAGKLPEIVMALIINFWESHGGIPKDVARLCFTFHDGIYQNAQMPAHLYAHEMVHYIRQGAGEDRDLAMLWWRQYVSDDKFRYNEELLAYKEQYRYQKVHGKFNRPQLFDFAKYLAKELSSEKYGNLCSFHQALGAIMGS